MQAVESSGAVQPLQLVEQINAHEELAEIYEYFVESTQLEQAEELVQVKQGETHGLQPV